MGLVLCFMFFGFWLFRVGWWVGVFVYLDWWFGVFCVLGLGAYMVLRCRVCVLVFVFWGLVVLVVLWIWACGWVCLLVVLFGIGCVGWGIWCVFCGFRCR